MPFYARSANRSGQQETVCHHLNRTAELCSSFLAPLGYESWGYMLGLMHDFGKYSALFQGVLNGTNTHVNHSCPGAALMYSLVQNNKALARMLPGVIASHHSALDFGHSDVYKRIWKGEGPAEDETGASISLFGAKALGDAFNLWKSDCKAVPLVNSPSFLDCEDKTLAEMFFMRFLFSALVDADYSSSAEHYDPEYLSKHSSPPIDAASTMVRLQNVLTTKKAGTTAAPELNQLREQLFQNCVEAGRQAAGLFTLTAPTGLGKTLSLLGFAAEHCRTHPEMRRIILVLPYLSIIEQNVKDYRAIIPDLLEVHSNADIAQPRGLTQRWDAPCIVTTNVGFLEPLFSSQPGVCRHLHQLTNSVIVFDEAQSLPPNLLDATLRSIKLLCDYCGCSVVFSTATQPSFQYRPGLAWGPREIVPNARALFEATKRVELDWRLDVRVSLEALSKEVSEFRQVCVIVNLRKHAHVIYQTLADKLGEESVFFMSSDMCVAHRSKVLAEVQKRLSVGLACRLVSTQCVEAGVDMDFPVLYRALAPLESIIQAAGRCNRNGIAPDGKVVVFIPAEPTLYPPGEYYTLAAMAVQELAKVHSIDCSNPDHIDEYYKRLYPQAPGDKAALSAGIQGRNFEEVDRAYKIVEHSGFQIIVPCQDTIDAYNEFYRRYTEEGLTPELIRMARPFTVSTYDKEGVAQCVQLYHHNKESGLPEPTNYYFLGIPAYYTEKQGIKWDVPFDGLL